MPSINLSEKMIQIARSLNANFSLNGRPLTLEEVFSPAGLLPGIARRADQLSALCLGYGIGATFEDVAEAPLGTKVIFDDLTPYTVRLLCLVDVLHELMRGTSPGGVTALDQLTYD